MTYVVTQPCCNDASCVEVCPVDCIRPTPRDPEYRTTEMLYIDPKTCIDCGACMDACPVDAIFGDAELPEEHEEYREINRKYFELHPLKSTGLPYSPSPTVKIPREEVPLRIAIVGSGPAASYAADELLMHGPNGAVEVEIFDRLPTPWGLVRAGVAPDHGGTKAVADLFSDLGRNKNCTFHLNVEVGRDISHEELMAHHHAVIYAVGALNDRRLDVPGEELAGSHAATEFVAWYNGHPDYADRTFDLSGERAVIIGNGNVALDIARILTADPDDLAGTDIAQHAIDALRESAIREVVVVGRRGPAQAAYTSPELMALGQIPGVDVVVHPQDLLLGEDSRAALEGVDQTLAMQLKSELTQRYALHSSVGADKRIVLRFLASPVAMRGNQRVESVEFVHNEIRQSADGTIRAHPTSSTEVIETGLVLRSIGYQGTPVPGVPFDSDRGIIPNHDGRVLDPRTNEPLTGTYVTGWIKRGPSGVIGTNKKCAHDTVSQLLTDFTAGRLSLDPPICL